MIEYPRYFWNYQIGFWLVIGCYLFMGGLTHLDFWIALVRNTYYPVVGFISSFLMIILFRKFAELKLTIRWVMIIISSILMASICTMAINPITFMQSGMAFTDLGPREITAGIFNYILIYLIWSLGYLHLDKTILRVPVKNRTKELKRLMLEKNNKIIPVNVTEITHVKAAGDYVEVYTSDNCFLNRSTLSAFAAELDHPDFVRSHRSIIVNLRHVRSLSPQAKGEYQLVLKNNRTLKASRTYAAEVREKLTRI